jgi:ferritin
MNIKEKVQKAVNKQINRELYSSYLYLSMSAYFESINLRGFANWVKVQADEERGHAMRLYDYLIDRGGRVLLSTIETPPSDWKSPKAVFENIYSHELKVTEMIYELLKTAKAEDDPATELMLQWFINEQVEEEAQPLLILEKIKMIRDSANGLLMLDHELGKRKGGE